MANWVIVELHRNSVNWSQIVGDIVRLERKIFPKHESLARSFDDELSKKNSGLLYSEIDGCVAGYVMYSWPSSLCASITKLAGVLDCTCGLFLRGLPIPLETEVPQMYQTFQHPRAALASSPREYGKKFEMCMIVLVKKPLGMWWDWVVVEGKIVVEGCGHECGHGRGWAAGENYRRQGLGEALLKAAIDRCRTRNVHRISLHVEPLRISAVNLYKKLGFQVDNLIVGYYSSNRNAFRMYLDFTSD
ncbi:hypothetical protein RJ640_008673 [Escallonia rubra]|uniref:N-acetyltransferase domain-containing protein n=1 Tax=Escallonia rubra TaxID=112253 RepID=A0AA88QH78_9ASTE|nr:hypothetical protein RJ640_008673 [Escallonia rubra]